MLTTENLLFLQKQLTFWDYLTPPQMQLLETNVTEAHYPSGQTVHSGETDCVGILLLQSGSMRAYMLSPEGKEVTLYRLVAGDICVLSASCSLKNITFDIHIDSEEACDVLVICPKIFMRLSKENLYVENFFLNVTIDRFSDVMWAMQELLFKSFEHRLASFLLDESKKDQTSTIHLTHEQIAKYVGSAREVVSRTLKHFEKEQIVSLARGSIQILNRNKLKTLIEY